MKSSTVVLAVICGALCLSGLQAQEPTPPKTAAFPFYGKVSGANVRLRGGPGDFHAILSMMEQGTLLRVNALEGEWYEAEIPGGLALYVCAKEGDRVYVEEEKPGRGIVRVSNLHVRGTRGTDHPPIGRLKAGQRIVVLDGEENWFRIVAPAGTKAYVHKDFVKPAADQKVARAMFAMRHVDASKRLMETGDRSKLMLAEEEAKVERKLEAKKAFEKYDEERGKTVAVRDIGGVRKDLMRVIDSAPEGDEDRTRAAALLATLDEWARLRQSHIELERKRKQVDAEAKARYAKEMEDLKRYMQEQSEKEATKESEDTRINGWIRKSFPVKGIENPITNFAIYRGKQRQYLLESDRYDLADFIDKLVVILEADEPVARRGTDLRVVKVHKLEILQSRL